MKNIELFYEPLDIFEQVMNDASEMNVHESAFLCGVIHEIKPKKVLEIGVAAGGSTICIMNCLQKLNLDCKVYSCDLNIEYYRDNTKNTGYLLEHLKDKFSNLKKHKFYLGDCLPAFIDEIGGNIDMVLIDTVHLLPGEILDFLVCLPHLSENAAVVLHDLCLNFVGNVKDAFATKVLFDMVVSDEKYKNYDESRAEQYSNIGMFKVTPQTRKYVEDIFSSLSISWSYYPEERVLKKYLDFFNREYSSDLCELFLTCCNLQKTYILDETEVKLENEVLAFNHLISQKTMYLYGTGFWGRRIYNYIKMKGGSIGGFISTNKEFNTLFGADVYTPDEFALFNKEECNILVAVSDAFYNPIMGEICSRSLEDMVYPGVGDKFGKLKFEKIKDYIALLDETDII